MSHIEMISSHSFIKWINEQRSSCGKWKGEEEVCWERRASDNFSLWSHGDWICVYLTHSGPKVECFPPINPRSGGGGCEILGTEILKGIEGGIEMRMERERERKRDLFSSNGLGEEIEPRYFSETELFLSSHHSHLSILNPRSYKQSICQVIVVYERERAREMRGEESSWERKEEQKF